MTLISWEEKQKTLLDNVDVQGHSDEDSPKPSIELLSQHYMKTAPSSYDLNKSGVWAPPPGYPGGPPGPSPYPPPGQPGGPNK